MSSNLIHVAIADDYAPIRKALRRFFEHEPGFCWAGEAADGDVAIVLAMTRHIDVMIMDLSKPGLGGLMALRHVRAAAPHIRMVVLSSYPASGYADKALGLGASAYLEKPTDLAVLAATLRKLMQEPLRSLTGNIASRD